MTMNVPNFESAAASVRFAVSNAFEAAAQQERQDVVTAISRNASAMPHKRAVHDSQLDIRYAELDAWSTVFAQRLMDLGCEPGDRVAMLARPRSVLVATIIGTFKAHAVHVPMDPSMPEARMEYVLRDVRPSVVIVEDHLAAEVAKVVGDATVLIAVAELVDAYRSTDFSTPRAARLPGAPRPDTAAYCIYTSGSTGRPKGVLISHGNMAAFMEGAPDFYDVVRDSICASFSPLHFDVYLMDMVMPLVRGASLHVYGDVISPDPILALLRDYQVTHFAAWGLMLELITRAEAFVNAAMPHVETILTGTEVPDVKVVQRWLAKNPTLKLINGYGPTEATCASTAEIIDQREPERKELYPIGTRLRHVDTFLVDGDDALITEPGIEGELLVGGDQVMLGYWNLQEETDKRITYQGDVRCYRTGDTCSYLPDGRLFYHGRRDAEVKLGGYRVHLNEVQRAACLHERVRTAEIFPVSAKYGGKMLAAALLIDTTQADEIAAILREVRKRLIDELPTYMIPRHLCALPNFPQLSSGKTDRKAVFELLRQRLVKQ